MSNNVLLFLGDNVDEEVEKDIKEYDEHLQI